MCRSEVQQEGSGTHLNYSWCSRNFDFDWYTLLLWTQHLWHCFYFRLVLSHILSVLCYSPGYRHVHLLKADGSSLSPATLFIHVKVVRRGVPIKTVSERKGKAWCFCHTVVPGKYWRKSHWAELFRVTAEVLWLFRMRPPDKKHDIGCIWTNSVRNNLKKVSVDLHLAFFSIVNLWCQSVLWTCYGGN